MLRYKGLYPEPHKGGSTGLKHYHHKLLDVTVPAGKWFNVQIYLKQSTNTAGKGSNYDGELTVWQGAPVTVVVKAGVLADAVRTGGQAVARGAVGALGGGSPGRGGLRIEDRPFVVTKDRQGAS